MLQRWRTAGAVLAMWLVCVPTLYARPSSDFVWTKLFGMEERALRFSPDGQWVVLGRTLYRNALSSTPQEPAALLEGRACFAGNSLLVVEEPRGITLRHLPSLRPVGALPERGSAFASQDGQWLLTVVRSTRRFFSPKEMHLWRTFERRLHLALPLEEHFPEPVLSADGSVLAYAMRETGEWSAPPVIVVMRPSDLREVIRLRPGEYVQRFALSPRGDQIAVSGANAVSVYETASGRLLHTFPNNPVLANLLEFSPDGGYLAAATSGYGWAGYWRLWCLRDGSLIREEETSVQEIYAMGFSPDSRSLWLAFRHRVQRVDVSTGEMMDPWFPPQVGVPQGFTPDSQQVVGLLQNEVLFTRLENGSLQRRVRLPESGFPYASALSPDAQLLALVSYDTYPVELRLYALSEPVATPVWSVLLESDLFQLQFTPDGSRLFGVEDTGRLQAWRVADGSRDPSVPELYLYPFTLSPDGRWIAGRSGRNLGVWRLPDFTLLYSLRDEVGVPQFSPDGRFLVVTEASLTQLRISVYDVPTGILLGLRYVSRVGEDALPPGVAVSPQGDLLVVRWENQLLFFRLPSLFSLGWRYVPSPPLVPYGVSFSPDGRYLLLGDFALLPAPVGDSVVGGYVQIPGWLGVAPEHLRYTLRRPETGEVVAEGTLSLNPDGLLTTTLFAIPVPAGRYWLTVSGRPFLTRTVDTAGGTLRVQLLAGDADGDNEVTLLDFGKVLVALGSTVGEARYDIDADLDGDGEVSLLDFAWLVRNFGLSGDE